MSLVRYPRPGDIEDVFEYDIKTTLDDYSPLNFVRWCFRCETIHYNWELCPLAIIAYDIRNDNVTFGPCPLLREVSDE